MSLEVLLVPKIVAMMPSCDTLTNCYTIACSGGGFPSSYNGTVFIAEHGSWARDPAIGYRIAAVKLAPNGTAVRHTIFASGWLLRNGTVWGAPFLAINHRNSSLYTRDFPIFWGSCLLAGISPPLWRGLALHLLWFLPCGRAAVLT